MFSISRACPYSHVRLYIILEAIITNPICAQCLEQYHQTVMFASTTHFFEENKKPALCFPQAHVRTCGGPNRHGLLLRASGTARKSGAARKALRRCAIQLVERRRVI